MALRRLDRLDLVCLQAFVALDDDELDAIAFSDSASAVAFDVPVVHKNVIAGISRYKAEALLDVKPLHDPGFLGAVDLVRVDSAVLCRGFALG